MSRTVTHAVVLAAGRGKRMMPLTANCPKPLLPVAGVPLLERILRGLSAGGIRETIIVHGYLGEMIEAYFGAGERVGMRLRYCRQETPDGTGGALRHLDALCGDHPFMLHWGDILIDPSNYPRLLAAYAATPVSPVCLLGLNWMEDPAIGAAVYQEAGRIVKIIEKPAPGTSTTPWNNAGAMVLDPRIWPYIHRLTLSSRGEYEFTEALHQMIANGDPVLPFELTGLWSDVGTPEVLEKLNGDPVVRGWDSEE